MKETEPLQTHDLEAHVREEAINRYLVGEKPTAICREMGRSRTWFYKALRRYQEGGRDALATQSRRPSQIANQTEEEVETAIVKIRQTILKGEDPSLRYGNIGAEAIAFELERLGLQTPSVRTINRILSKHGLQQARRKKKQKNNLPDDYPWPCVTQPNQLHLLDFVTRATRTMRRVYGCNLLDYFGQRPFLRLVEYKTRQNVVNYLVSVWQTVGLPNALYIDNDPVWRGSSSGKRSFSFIVRLCLRLGIDVVFTPPYTPEANPLIEGFNGIWERNFWQRTTFASLAHMTEELSYFQTWCHQRRPLSHRNGLSPSQLYADFEPVCPPADFSLHQQEKLPLTAGFVHFIRFLDDQHSFSILNETWTIKSPPATVKTIRATIDTRNEQLLVYHQPSTQLAPIVLQQFPYEVNQKVLPRLFGFERPFTSLWPEL